MPNEDLFQDLFAPTPLPAAPTPRGIVLCEFDGTLVGIPQQDAITIEHGARLAAPLAGERVIGWFESDRGPWPVYALDRELRPVDALARNRAFIVFLKSAAEPIGILCDGVRILGTADELAPQALPEPLASCAPANTRVAFLDEQIALLFDAGQFAQHLQNFDGATLGDTVIHRRPRRLDQATSSSAESTAASVRAWLLEWPVQPIALALCEVIEIADEPHAYLLPFGPPWCRSLLYWRDRFIPLARADARNADAHIVVTAFQQRAGEELRYAAFAVEQPPRQITVQDGCDCDAPYAVFGEGQLRASFTFENRAIVVPELAMLFARESAAA